MMSDYYEHYHRCETLAEFNFYFGDDTEEDINNDDNYVYCYCSRVFIRDGVKTYYAEKEYASESDVEVHRDSQSQDWEDHSHVHFSLDTSYKVKCERDEGASCYCSASHTDNCCSTDEHDAVHTHGTVSHALQPSDSGADLTYQDYHSDTHDKLERVDQDFSEINENYMAEDTWEKFWAVNGERLIWASWIQKYSDYINPAYLDENNGLIMDENNIPKQHSVDQIYKKQTDPSQNPVNEDMRERKFSYDSKVNPYKKSTTNQNQPEKVEKNNEQNKDDAWLPVARRRSCSEHDRILSPWTVTGTDSMTNVTKLTISSYDVTSSHVTSDSTPTDTDYSVSSSSSDDPSNDQTRIANIDEKYDSIEQVPEETDPDQYWQFLWKKHFGEQYALHFANYSEQHDIKEIEMPEINIEVIPEQAKTEEKLEVECENSEGNSQDTPTVIEIQNQVEQITLEDKGKAKKTHKKKHSKKYLSSVGVLLQTLLKEERAKLMNEPVDVGDNDNNTNEVHNTQDSKTDVVDETVTGNMQQTVNGSNLKSSSYDDGDDEPPEETPTALKRSHELDEDEDEDAAFAKIKSTIQMLGFYAQQENMPKGELIYRKRLARLRPPRYKRFAGRKTYFDDDGNAYTKEQTKDSADEREMQTDDDCTEVKSDTEKLDEVPIDLKTQTQLYNFSSLDENSKLAEAAAVPLPCDAEDSDDEQKTEEPESNASQQVESTKRKKRSKKYPKLDEEEASAMPPELRDDPKMYKYWKKRYSLFHRYDEGIRMDRESWFSVTPEKVAWHIANKYMYDVVLDAFCGAGGNTIQFAYTSKEVIAIDIDPIKIEMAKHNATVYGVADRIKFIVGDFFKLAPQLKADMVFLSPPWGGPNYTDNLKYDLETMMPWPASEMMRVARMISPTISLFLPRTSRLDQILALAKGVGGSVEVEQSFLDRKPVAITAYYY